MINQISRSDRIGFLSESPGVTPGLSEKKTNPIGTRNLIYHSSLGDNLHLHLCSKPEFQKSCLPLRLGSALRATHPSSDLHKKSVVSRSFLKGCGREGFPIGIDIPACERNRLISMAWKAKTLANALITVALKLLLDFSQP